MFVCGGGVRVWWRGVKLEVVQSRATGFITGTTELPPVPAR